MDRDKPGRAAAWAVRGREESGCIPGLSTCCGDVHVTGIAALSKGEQKEKWKQQDPDPKV